MLRAISEQTGEALADVVRRLMLRGAEDEMRNIHLGKKTRKTG